MADELKFETRQDMRKWLYLNSQTSGGVWLLFEKGKTISANDALEEALCFGWIDGLMKNIDSTSYKKYFAKRTKNSKWSEKNKKLVIELVNKGLMTDYGLDAINIAKSNGMWEIVQKNELDDSKITEFRNLISINETAVKNFDKMTPSIRKNYIYFYYDAKTDDGRKKRIQKIIDRLEQNLKPM